MKKVLLFCLDDAGGADRANYEKSIALLQVETEGALEICRVVGGQRNGSPRLEECWWRASLVFVLEVLDEL